MDGIPGWGALQATGMGSSTWLYKGVVERNYPIFWREKDPEEGLKTQARMAKGGSEKNR